MSTGPQVPDYDLEDVRIVTTDRELKAMFHPFRSTLLQLLLTRAATIGELAMASRRPKGTVAYHVRVLEAAGMVTPVRTRTVRGQRERFYGRTARLFTVGEITTEQLRLIPNAVPQWAADTEQAHEADELRGIRRYAWISDEHADEFWERVLDLVHHFSQLPGEADGRAYAFITAFYPTDHPRLRHPEAE